MNATTNSATVNINTIETPNLNNKGRTALLTAMAAFLGGMKVEIAVSYTKTTKTKARVEGEDYKGLLGTPASFLTGRIAMVAEGKNGIYILLDATTVRRPIDGDGLGWTAIKGAGVKAVLGVRIEEKPGNAD
jgi:hypothetical protein